MIVGAVEYVEESTVVMLSTRKVKWKLFERETSAFYVVIATHEICSELTMFSTCYDSVSDIMCKSTEMDFEKPALNTGYAGCLGISS